MVDIATENYSSRNGAKVIWVAIHTTEGIMDANDLGYYWQRITNGSSHAGCDSTKTKTYVDTAYASWTLLNGNSRSVNMEICGWAKWTREEWLGPHRGRLVQAANWARQMCDKFGIPKRYIGAAGVAKGEAGIIGHVDYTNGAKDGNHWDPGPGFPWDVFIKIVNEGDDDVNEQQDAYLREIWSATSQRAGASNLTALHRHVNFLGELFINKIDEVTAKLAALSAKIDAIETGGVSKEEIANIAVDAVEKKLES